MKNKSDYSNLKRFSTSTEHIIRKQKTTKESHYSEFMFLFLKLINTNISIRDPSQANPVVVKENSIRD